MENKEYKFRFMVIPVKAEISDEFITVKIGLQKSSARISDLTYLYIVEHEGVGQELILTYEKGNGKTCSIRVNTDYAEAEFRSFVNDILVRRPDIDIRHLPLREALKLTRAADFTLLIPAIMFFIIVSIVAFIFSPGLVHGFDSGREQIDIAACEAACRVKSRNLEVIGCLAYDFGISETITEDNNETVEYYIPVVPCDWQPENPVYMVLKTPDLSDEELEELYAGEYIPGVLRDFLWEGLSGDKKKFFEKEYDITIADEVRLLEYNADTRMELVISISVIICSAIFFLAVSIFVYMRTMKANRGKPEKTG